MARIDYYLTLGVTRDVSREDLKKAYRRLAVLWHPDRNPGSLIAEERFKAVAEAYAVLSSPAKRHQYDTLGPKKFKNEYSGEKIFQGFEPEDFFKSFGLTEARDALERILKNGIRQPMDANDPSRLDDFFADFGQTESRSNHRSPDILVSLVLSFKEAALGATKMVAYNTSSGVVKVPVTVPPASLTGGRLTLKSQGPGDPGCHKGDLIVTFTVTPDPSFTRLGHDLKVTLKVSSRDLTEGSRPVVTTLEGASLRLTIPKGSQSGTVFRIPGRGLLRPAGGHGDLLVQVFTS